MTLPRRVGFIALVVLCTLGLGHSSRPPPYDYVIVGGGTAGSVLASRLTEDPSVSVALIEAGGSVQDNVLVKSIYGDCLSCATPIDWNYTSTPQVHLNNRTFAYHAGKCLGGSSAINGLLVIVINYLPLLTTSRNGLSQAQRCRVRYLEGGG